MILPKTVLITGSTDGIGLKTAEAFVSEGHVVILHGRNPEKLEKVMASLSAQQEADQVLGLVADLSRFGDVVALADQVSERVGHLDVLINNAGVLKLPEPRLPSGLDLRFVVNTFAPFLLTRRLLPLMGSTGRIINVSSAAQAPVDRAAIGGEALLSDMAAYAQSKLALTMWSRYLADKLGPHGASAISVNPGSMLGSKMVQEGFGVAGGDLAIGADILFRLAMSDEFASASGRYYDNDAGRFAEAPFGANDPAECAALVRQVEASLDLWAQS